MGMDEGVIHRNQHPGVKRSVRIERQGNKYGIICMFDMYTKSYRRLMTNALSIILFSVDLI